jgi:hypothetical protein
MVDWETVKLPRDMIQRLNEFVESNYAKDNGFTSKSQVIVFAVREFLRSYSGFLAYLDYIEFENNVVKIMDHELGTIVSVEIDRENTTLFCKKHNSDTCNHVRFLWMLPRFSEELKKFEKPLQKGISKVYTKEDILEGLQIPIRQSTYNKLKDKKIVKKKMIEILKEITKDLEK